MTAPTPVRLPVGSVKICGLREPDHARAAVAAGADLVGFIFAPARRRVTVGEAAACVAAARAEAGAAGRPVLAVGVFVDAPPAEMAAAAGGADLDLLQLHGSGSWGPDVALARPALRVLRPVPGSDAADLEATLLAGQQRVGAPVAVLVDGLDPAAPGGTGVRADWALAAGLARRWPLLLAGGLTPGNVADAIERVRPRGVDVSSGVETDGTKDIAKIAAFVGAAKRAFARRAEGSGPPCRSPARGGEA